MTQKHYCSQPTIGKSELLARETRNMEISVFCCHHPTRAKKIHCGFQQFEAFPLCKYHPQWLMLYFGNLNKKTTKNTRLKKMTICYRTVNWWKSSRFKQCYRLISKLNNDEMKIRTRDQITEEKVENYNKHSKSTLYGH